MFQTELHLDKLDIIMGASTTPNFDVNEAKGQGIAYIFPNNKDQIINVDMG